MTTTPETDHPTSPEDLQEIVASALDRAEPLEIVGSGGKRFYGHAAQSARTVSLAAMKGIVDYQPGELICVVLAGTPLAELEATLEKEGQALAFEPPHWSPGATIGGTVACNLAGPRRFKAGATRDHLLGFQAVGGRGEIFRAGGRVVKNVTGYDLSKLMCGSFGTLGILTEVCLKVLPRGETERTLWIAGKDDRGGVGLLIRAARTSHDVSGLAHVPGGADWPGGTAPLGGDAATLIRLEGPEASVAYRARKLAEMAGADWKFLDGEESRAVWRAVREVDVLKPGAGESLWRFSVPPTRAVDLVQGLNPGNGIRTIYDWGGGLVWGLLPDGADPLIIHQSASDLGGSARLVRPSVPVDSNYPIFQPLEAGRRRLHVNLKQAFDPAGILNPGRMYPDF